MKGKKGEGAERQDNRGSGKRLYCPALGSEGRRLEHCPPDITGL